MRAHHAKKGNRRPATDRGGAAPLSPAGTRFSRPGNAPRSARSGRRVFPENTINIDKFTGYFDKFLNGENLASYCNQRISNKYLSAVDSNMAEKILKRAAFARIWDETGRVPRICPHLPPARGCAVPQDAPRRYPPKIASMKASASKSMRSSAASPTPTYLIGMPLS